MSTGDHFPTVLIIVKNPNPRILTLHDPVPMQIVDLQPWNNIIILKPPKKAYQLSDMALNALLLNL